MIVVDVRCADDHRFEGWFASSEAFENQRATGMPKPFFGRFRIDAGSLSATAALSNRLPVPRAYLWREGNAWTKSTSSASRNGARTSRLVAMLARSTFVRMSSGR